MDIKAVIFDLGNTLLHYTDNINWTNLYSPAIRQVLSACNLPYCKKSDLAAQKILTKYNTRVNFRDYEVSSDTIFTEMLNCWGASLSHLFAAKHAFYTFFQKDVVCYDDTISTLSALKARGIKIGVLTDVPYGMDNEYVLKDLDPIKDYIDICLTSNDTGHRKPNPKGFKQIVGSPYMVTPSQQIPNDKIAYIGDEQKDIDGANSIGLISILINRSSETKNWGQDHTISKLSELLAIL